MMTSMAVYKKSHQHDTKQNKPEHFLEMHSVQCTKKT